MLAARLLFKMRIKSSYLSKTYMSKPLSVPMTEIVSKALAVHEQRKNINWESVKSEVINRTNKLNVNGLNSAILKSCIALKKYNLAMNFIEYLKRNGEMNLSVIGKIFVLYNAMYQENMFTDKDELEMLKLYKTLKINHKVLDAYTAENVIVGLSISKSWKLCLDILNDVKNFDVPSNASYNNIVIAAFSNRNEELGWNLLTEIIGLNRDVWEECYISYLKSIDPRSDKAKSQLEVLFTFMGNNDLICTEKTVNYLLNHFNKTMDTFISDKGICNNCKTKIPKTSLQPEEFALLKNSFFDKVIIGKDIFQKSSPEELENFRRFLNADKKYDVIIDGLNVAYSLGVNKSPEVGASLVANVVRHFTDKNMEVLLLGRRHMLKWPRHHLQFIKNNSDLFLTQNLSQDDPYFLYCALSSGPQTIIVTRDLMRNYLYLLKDVDLKRLFSRWISQSQYQLVKVARNGKVTLMTPKPYLRTCQKNGGHWHIPYNAVAEDGTTMEKWKCISLDD